MSKTRNKKSKNSQIPIFISKLAEILQNQQISDIVSWTTTRDSFIIKNIPRFTEQTLPSYFKHHNFASFIRQLNMYGFNKKRHPDGDNVYMNQYFKQGSRHLLSNIARKIKQDKEQAVAVYNPTEPSNQTRVSKQIQDLKNKQKNLQEMCKRFLIQNQKLLQQNQSIVHKMDKQSKQKQKRLQQFLIYLIAQKNARAINEQGGQLSLMNSQVPIQIQTNTKESDATPLELIAENMDRDQNFKKMKNILNNAYNNRKSKRKDNFTIVNTKRQQNNIQLPNDPLNQSHLNHQYSQDISQIPIPVNVHDPRQQDNKSFISINDFINAQGYQDFDLQQSN